jgi:uncharacterized membrane protein YcaP (DUF421 family)
MELLHIFLTSLGSVAALFLLTKIIGNRQMSQLSMFDYINGITIGSIAAEMATALEDDFLKPLTAMVVYALLSLLFSFVTGKSVKMRRFLTGETLILLDNGKIFKKNLKRAKLDLSEFLTQCRTSGYFNIANIQTALLEPNGKISFLPVSSKRPVIPCDLDLTPTQEKIVVNVIIDGEILYDNLKYTGNDEQWLKKQLHAQGISKPSDIFLATCDNENHLSIYIKIEKGMTRDPFE